ncbi:MAG: rhodanese-like domain-containing protein [Candidatus Gastranaerophilaceae bacterium]
MSEYIDKIRRDTQVAEGFFAEKLAFTLGPVELKKMLADKKVKLIDVRRKEDFDEGHIPEAISIPKEELKARLAELSKGDIHVICCYNQQCHLAAAAALTLAQNGYPVMELDGGFQTWKEDFGFEVVK